MKHLTVEEITDFVSMTECNREAFELSAVVNGHIRKCERCLQLVRSYQMLYDEFAECNRIGSFREYSAHQISGNRQEGVFTNPEEPEGHM